MPSAIPYQEPTMEPTSPTKAKKRAHSENTKAHKKQKKSENSISRKIEDKEGKKDKKRVSHKIEKTEELHGVKSKEKKEKKEKKPLEVNFPFFTQTISLWVPLYPVGFDRPISSVADQHLTGLVNHYSPLLGGYLLAYHNVNLSDSSIRANPNHPPDDTTPAILTSVDEYAVGYGWMTVDIDLFVPSRGAWLEGNVILQNEGSIGVNCWEKFNASIEASRLPSNWKYVNFDFSEDNRLAKNDHYNEDDKLQENESQGNSDEGDEQPDDQEGKNMVQTEETKDTSQPLTAQVHSTGYWVDESGNPVKGNILFRIKDFDVGLAGDNGYLAIEGTMLEPEDEFRLMLSERSKNRVGSSGGKTRQLPEFSITQFGKEDEEEDSNQHIEVSKGSQVVTSDD